MAAGSRAQAGLGKGRAAWAVLAARALAVGPAAQADWAVGRPRPGRFCGPPVGFRAFGPISFRPFVNSPFHSVYSFLSLVFKCILLLSPYEH